jgi:hypothetical protein
MCQFIQIVSEGRETDSRWRRLDHISEAIRVRLRGLGPLCSMMCGSDGSADQPRQDPEAESAVYECDTCVEVNFTCRPEGPGPILLNAAAGRPIPG